MKQRLLITGAAGQLGRALSARLRPDWDLTLFDLAAAPADDVDRVIVGDIANPEDVRKAMADVDAILHLASSHGETINFEQTLDANYRGTIHLLDTAVATGVRSIVFASSNHGWGLYPRTRAPLMEDQQPRPDGWYGVSKIWNEAVMSLYADAHGLTATSLRIGNCGPSVPDERRLHMWISFDDLATLSHLALTRKGIGHRGIFATADCDSPFFDTTGAREIGFVTKHRPEEHIAHPDVLKEAAPNDIFGRSIGGSYSVANFKANIDRWEAGE